MVGWLVIKEERGRRPVLDRTSILGFPLLKVEVPIQPGLRGKAKLRRIERAAALLYQSGCRRLLAAESFPHWDALLIHGLRPVDPAPLCQCLAAPLALAVLRQAQLSPEQATVALCGGRVSRPFFQCAQALCCCVRRLVISAPVGGEDLAQYLRSEYGIPVLEEGASLSPDVTLLFIPPSNAPDGRTLQLCNPGLNLAGLTLKPQVKLPPPGEADPLALTALLWEEGRLQSGDLDVILNESFRKLT